MYRGIESIIFLNVLISFGKIPFNILYIIQQTQIIFVFRFLDYIPSGTGTSMNSISSIDAQFSSSVSRSTSRESSDFPSWWTAVFRERVPAKSWCRPQHQRRVRGSILATPRPLLDNPARIYSSLPSALARGGK